MSDERNIRHRFTVPSADVKVNEWIETQSNLGFSLRVLIKAFIRDYGMQDATCLELGTGVKRRGRPPKNAQIHMSQMLDDTEYATNYDENYVQESEVTTNYVAQEAVSTVQVSNYSQPVQSVPQYRQVKPVPQQLSQQRPIQQVQQNVPMNNQNSADIMSMIGVGAVQQQQSVKADDNDFVDPDDIL